MTFSGKTPFIIGICGGSGAGKTTLLRRLSDIFGEVRPSIFSMDNYYFPKNKINKLVNFDAMYYCASEMNILQEVRDSSNYQFIKANLTDKNFIDWIVIGYFFKFK